MGISRYLAKLGAMLGSDGRVPTDGLADGAVTAAKIAAGAVPTPNDASALTQGTLAIARIADGTITGAKLEASGVTAGNYGSAANAEIPSITVDAKGRVTAVAKAAANYGGALLITSSQVWTVPPGIFTVKVLMCSGGGAGGGAAANGSFGGGGGGGAIIFGVYSVTPGQQISITVGAGGVGVAGGTGGTGGSTSFGSYATCTGGSGGLASITGPSGGGSGGSTSGTYLFGYSGNKGENVYMSKGPYAAGAGGAVGIQNEFQPMYNGGNSANTWSHQLRGVFGYFVGLGGRGRYNVGYAANQGTGEVGTGYGCGGGGAYRANTTYAGGNGTPGVVLLEY